MVEGPPSTDGWLDQIGRPGPPGPVIPELPEHSATGSYGACIAPLGIPTYFGTLEIVARSCRETPPTEPPESAAFLEIRELPPASDADAPPIDRYSGWMFASSPAVAALEHPVYDIWVVDCEEPLVPPENDQGRGDAIPPPSE